MFMVSYVPQLYIAHNGNLKNFIHDMGHCENSSKGFSVPQHCRTALSIIGLDLRELKKWSDPCNQKRS